MNFNIYRYDTLGSTNDEAKRLAELGEAEGTVVVAEAQTAGRGRSGRRWITPPGAALALSIILRPRLAAIHTAQVALLGGLAVLEGIQQLTRLPLQLKWPNDVLARNRKVAGALAESAFAGNQLDSVVLGIGVNVNAAPPNIQLEYAATSLAAELGSPLDREAVLNAILKALEVRYPQLGEPALAAAWAEHLAMRGEQVRVSGLSETVLGILEGVRGDGALVIRLENGELRTILAGDVHLRS